MRTHRIRKRVALPPLLALLGLAWPWPLEAREDGALWRQAVELAERNERWVPGSILEREVVTNRHGEIEEVSERGIRILRTERGSLKVELIRAVLSRRDVTSSEKQDFDEQAQHEYLSEDPQENPFSSGLQQGLQLIGPGRLDRLEDTECTLFSYTQTTKEAEWAGQAWLESTTGTPLRVQFWTDERFEEDGAAITNLTGSIEYHHGGPGEWYPRELSYTMDIDTKVFPLVRFRGRVEITVSLRDHFRLDRTGSPR